MKLSQLIWISVLLAALASCNPTHVFTVSNTSQQDKRIQVVLPANHYDAMGLRDSIFLQSIDKADTSKYWPIKVDKDSLTKSYSFTLPSQHDAVLEFGVGARPVPGQKIVINETDSIVVEKKTQRIVKRPRIGLGRNKFKLTIAD